MIRSIAGHPCASRACGLNFGYCCVYELCVDIVKDYRSAALTQLPAYLATDTGSCAGDNGNVVLKG
jgi:hypothetical protein